MIINYYLKQKNHQTLRMINDSDNEWIIKRNEVKVTDQYVQFKAIKKILHRGLHIAKILVCKKTNMAINSVIQYG